MAKVRSLEEAVEKSQSGGGADFFALENDKDQATVRFLQGTLEDITTSGTIWFPVHEVEINGKNRYVLCAEEDDCPLCLANNKVKYRAFLQLLDKRDGKHKIWERGVQYLKAKILPIVERKGALFTRPYDIVRSGKKGDTKTDYNLFDYEADGKTQADLPKPVQIVGPDSLILEKTYEEMREILNGTYKPTPRNASSNAAGDNRPSGANAAEPTARQSAPKGKDDVF